MAREWAPGLETWDVRVRRNAKSPRLFGFRAGAAPDTFPAASSDDFPHNGRHSAAWFFSRAQRGREK